MKLICVVFALVASLAILAPSVKARPLDIGGFGGALTDVRAAGLRLKESSDSDSDDDMAGVVIGRDLPQSYSDSDDEFALI